MITCSPHWRQLNMAVMTAITSWLAPHSMWPYINPVVLTKQSIYCFYLIFFTIFRGDYIQSQRRATRMVRMTQLVICFTRLSWGTLTRGGYSLERDEVTDDERKRANIRGLCLLTLLAQVNTNDPEAKLAQVTWHEHFGVNAPLQLWIYVIPTSGINPNTTFLLVVASPALSMYDVMTPFPFGRDANISITLIYYMETSFNSF